MAKVKTELRLDEVPLDSIPEVAAHEALLAQWRKFQDDNPELFSYIRQFEEQINNARQAADKAVRAKGVSCGSWHKYQVVDKLNADVAYQIHGHERFLALGGTLETVTKKKLDKPRYMSNVAANVVTPEEKAAVVTTENRYHAPDEMVVPE
jgi:hypothetical protein